MKIKTLVPHVGEYGNPKGLVFEVSEEAGKKLIAMKYAEKAPANAKVTEEK
ncbi:hypothetical protein [Priestia megaterium]|uniref:hypothetical protein n=1 Tax=Priestia megaterium TaxID=1404 RepID=UPI0015CF0BF9|nr:hypothetical protein [Priestia megaterium]